MPEKRRKHWKGGYVRRGKKGPTYVIERWIGGTYFHISTKCRTKEAAEIHLARFEADPVNYSPTATAAEVLTITPDLVREYSAWMRETKKNSDEWIATVARFLAHWRQDLGNRDLRELNIQRDLKPALEKRGKSRKHRIEALKAFCSWLRREKGLLTLADDRTVDLPVPKSVAAKISRRRAVSQDDVQLVLAKLAQGRKEHFLALQQDKPEAERERWHPRPHSDTDTTRDVLLLQTGTAWHVSEVRRFAEGGEIVRPASKNPKAVLVTRHKSGELTRTPINTDEHLAAAERLRARKGIPEKETLVDHLAWACEAVREDQAKAKVPEARRLKDFRLGVLRHSVLTWAVEMGATPQQASEFAGHRSVATSKKFYIDVAEPTVSVPVLRLVGKT